MRLQTLFDPERVPRADALLASRSLEQLAARRESVEGRVNDIVNMDEVAELGTAGQRAQWQRILAIESAMASAPADEQAAARDKLRLIKGVLYWDLKQSFRDRLEIELWRSGEAYLYRFEPGDARLPKKSEK